MKLLLIGLAIGLIVYVASGGRIIFLPLLLLLPFGFAFGSRRRTSLLRPRRKRWPWQGF
jgi:hypothetical protein